MLFWFDDIETKSFYYLCKVCGAKQPRAGNKWKCKKCGGDLDLYLDNAWQNYVGARRIGRNAMPTGH